MSYIVDFRIKRAEITPIEPRTDNAV